MVTIRDIAEELGVNISTVSRALNGKKSVSEELRTQILQVAQEMGYQPNLSAQALVGKSSKTFGVIVPEINSSYFASSVNHLEHTLNKVGYTLLIGIDHYDSQKTASCLRVFKQHRVDGIFLMGSMHQNIERQISTIFDRYLPIVFLHSFFLYPSYDCVCVNDTFSSNLIVEHLKQNGHKKIGYIGAELACRNRFAKIHAAVEQAGLIMEERHIKIGKDAYEQCGYNQTLELLKEEDLPTALIASYDYVAIGSMKALIEHGIRIPSDIAIVGYDNVRESKYLTCPLTTVDVPINQIVNAGVEIMINRVQDGRKREIRHVFFEPELIVRRSSDPNSAATLDPGNSLNQI